MKVMVIGATGRVGAFVVEHALGEQHEVAAYIRNPAKVAVKHPMLRVVKGEIADQERLLEALGSGCSRFFGT